MNSVLSDLAQSCEHLEVLFDFELGDGSGWDSFKETHVLIKSGMAVDLRGLFELESLFESAASVAVGWAMWQRKLGLEVLDYTQFRQRLGEGHVPLEAEFGDDSESFAVQFRNGAWYWVHICEVMAGTSGGQAYLACDQYYLGTAKAPGRLQYRVFWVCEEGEVTGYRPALSRFLGFSKEGRF